MSAELNQYFRVLEFPHALQTVQGMESRGDFQFKGIYRFFMTISEWTDKFTSQKALPTAEQLLRDTGLEKEKVELFLNELCFKNQVPLVKKISTIEFDPNNAKKSETLLNSGLKRNTVFARPSALDGGTAQRYINGCNESSVTAIKKFLSEWRSRQTGDKFRDFINTKISTNKIAESYASAEITQLFNCPLDTSKFLKEATINLHIKPVLKKLVDDKALLFFRNETAAKTGNKSIFLYNQREEIAERIEIYVNYLKKNLVPNFQKIGVLGNISEDDYLDFARLATMLLTYMNDSYGDQKTLVEELIILGNFYQSFKEEQSKKEQKEKIIEIIKLIQNAGKLVDVATIRLNGEEVSKEIMVQVFSNEGILYAEYSDGKDLFEYVLHKSNINLAVDLAKKVYAATQNDTDIRILSRMNIHTVSDEAAKKEFYNIEVESLFKYLPFLTRFWRSIMGNIFVTKEEAALIKSQKEAEQKRRVIDAKAKQIAKEKARLVEERMKQLNTDGTPAITSAASSISVSADTKERLSVSMEEEKMVKDNLKAIIQILDSAWDAKIFPDREYVLPKLQGMNEDEFVMFLKKYAHKEILSFQVKGKGGPNAKYKWPILISRNYAKRQGPRLLERAMKESDEERASITPSQDKFDLYSSMEDFLNRVAGKL